MKDDSFNSSFQTHSVNNQPPPLENINLYQKDKLLQNLLLAAGLDWGSDRLMSYGQKVGSSEWMQKGFTANQNPPVLHSHDRFGHRIDEVRFHPVYHELMSAAIEDEIHVLPWKQKKPGAHLLRMALFYLHSQNEAGSSCPLSMTFASVPALQKTPSVAASWLPKILSNSYDKSNQLFSRKTGLAIGMAMTEKQGGTDVRANTTQAQAIAASGPGETYQLVGHKWFCSAPMCDAFLTLAQTKRGLSCFLLPRWKPDGQKNGFQIQRLKDKLGNRSNASCEVEFSHAHAQLLGEEGLGINTIIEMVALTRYDCMIGSTALMRRALTETIHHISHRKVSGKLLIDQPLMQNVVADLSLEVAGALAMTVRASQCLEQAGKTASSLLLRLLLPVGKYWICKRAMMHIAESMECLGGNGYIEESVLPRLYREAPVNSIWEGSGNVQCLDILRALSREPAIKAAFLTELDAVKGMNTNFDSYLLRLKQDWEELQSHPQNARLLAEGLATTMQAAQLLKWADPALAEAFCISRLGERKGHNFGTLPKGILFTEIIKSMF